jgi:hypothetical protein
MTRCYPTWVMAAIQQSGIIGFNLTALSSAIFIICGPFCRELCFIMYCAAPPNGIAVHGLV